MQIKEIELDLPYQENYDYIEKIIRENGLSNEEANSKDYIDNWKEKRLKFRLDTRCMTSMIERLTFPVKSMSFWKIMIECVSQRSYIGYKNLLGVCVIQYEFNYSKFNGLSDIEKKKETVKIILDAIKEIDEFKDIYIKIKNASAVIESNNYINQWFWKKKAKLGKNTAKLMIIHNVKEVEVHLIICDKEQVIVDKIIATCKPDERAFIKYFGEIGWKSPSEAYLITKEKELYTVSV